MSGGGTIYRCPECARLVIYGQTCTCGKQTSRPSAAASHFETDANPLALALMFAGTGLAWGWFIVAVGMAVVR